MSRMSNVGRPRARIKSHKTSTTSVLIHHLLGMTKVTTRLPRVIRAALAASPLDLVLISLANTPVSNNAIHHPLISGHVKGISQHRASGDISGSNRTSQSTPRHRTGRRGRRHPGRTR